MADQVLKWGKETLALERAALAKAEEALGDSFLLAVRAIHASSGKVIATGLGKSGHIATKVASTLASTGTPSIFLHPSEALHGDFGMIAKGDTLLAIAYGGETREVLSVCHFAKGLGISVIAITGFLDSPLAKIADFVLSGNVEKEADPFGIVPTSSSTVALALGDALAIALMQLRGFDEKRFAMLHPGGRLGKKITAVTEMMLPREVCPAVDPSQSLADVLHAISTSNLGITAVIENDILRGAITDGDIRRALLRFGATAHKKIAAELMTSTPKKVDPDSSVLHSITLMEQNKITSVFVCTETGKLLGLVRLHDLLTAKVI